MFRVMQKALRRAIYAGEIEEGRALLRRAQVLHIATTEICGKPHILVVHPVVVPDGAGGELVAFHGAPAGQKMEGLGRQAVASAHETIAEIPSWFLDPERACPATTYYVSVQVEGVLEEVTEPALKARVLQALMEKFQPEGRHVPVTADDPRYAKAVRGLLVAAIRIDALTCKAKLGQNRRPEERTSVLRQLWERGGPQDLAAVDFLTRRFPELAPPAFRSHGLSFFCRLAPEETEEVLGLLKDAYWLAPITEAQRRKAIAESAVVFARDGEGICAFARAVSDGRVAWIYDVMVRPDRRGTGVGKALFAFLLEHPSVRNTRMLRLGTRDAMDFYRRFGFVDFAELQAQKPYVSTEMARLRD